MKYYDTDVLIHFIVVQDKNKHKLANELLEDAIAKNLFGISLLTLQEMAFVLSKLGVSNEVIRDNLNVFLNFESFICKKAHFQQALILADKIGFQSINDCIHTAIAEECCDELITFNGKDFVKIKQHTKLNITIL